MKNIKFKLLLLLISTSLSVLCVEVYVRSRINTLNAPALFSQYKEYKLNEAEYAGREEYIRDYSLEHFSGEGEFELLFLGDSFTNGGNVEWESSYPFQLFKRLENRVSVRNLGVCSSTTFGASQRLREFINSQEYNKNKKYILGVMVGSADFLANEKEIPIVEIDKEKIKNVNMNNIKTKSFFTRSYFLRMLAFIYNEFETFFHEKKLTFSGHYKFLKKFDECSVDETYRCEIEILKNAKKETKKDEFELLLYLSQKKLSKKNSHGSLEIAKMLNLNIMLIETFPELMERDDLVMSTLSLIRLQSKFSTQDVIERLRKQNQKASLVSMNKNNELFLAASKWVKDEEKILSNSKKALLEIINIAKENKIKIFLMNYPLSYNDVNLNISSTSLETSTPMLNINSAFSKLSDKVLIDDWEHCTPEGYEVIATEIQKLLMSDKDWGLFEDKN